MQGVVVAMLIGIAVQIYDFFCESPTDIGLGFALNS